MTWDDLHYFLALSRAGTLAAAARALAVDETTVGRRLAALEKSLAARLFDRTRAGVSLTPLGRELLPRVEEMEAAALSVERRASGEEARLSGRVRVATTEAFAARFLLPELQAFNDRYPSIELELVTGYALANLSRREAELSIRAARPTEPEVVGRKAADMAAAIYASEQYLARFGPLDPATGMGGHRVIGYPSAARAGPESRWWMTHAPQATVALRLNSVLGIVSAAVAGLGLALLPCFIGDTEAGLRRALPPEPQFRREVWLVVHRDLQRNARVRAVLGFLTELIEREAPLLRGAGFTARAPGIDVPARGSASGAHEARAAAPKVSPGSAPPRSRARQTGSPRPS